MKTEVSLEFAHRLLPARPVDAHKGTFGHLFVLAGSRGFTGAAKLVCRAAARSGAGLVTAGIPRPLADILALSLTETMTFPLPASEQETFSAKAVQPALEFAADKQAVVLGPGLSQHPNARSFAVEFVSGHQGPLVVDADALNALGAGKGLPASRESGTVLTPHPGEMARLAGLSNAEVQANRESIAREYAVEHRCTLVLKGHRTLVVNPGGDTFVNSTGNSGLAGGGTGDVLAGVIGALLAQGMDSTDAAILGVYAHGLAGDLAAARKSERGLIASDVVEALPDAWLALEKAE